jgi:hypothetical protein
MGDSPRSLATGSWSMRRLYRAIVAIYLLGMSVGAAIILTQYLWFYFHPVPNSQVYGPGPEFYLLPPIGLIAVSGLAAFMLITEMKGPFVRLFLYAVLFLWSLVTVAIFLGMLNSVGEADMKGFGIEEIYPQYLWVYALAGVNGMVYFFLHEAHSERAPYRLRLNSPVGIFSIALIGGFVALAVWYMVLLTNPSLSYSATGHLPDSLFSQAVRDSPEGQAFFARYPNSDVYVSQAPNCCSVTLSYLRDKADTCISREGAYWCRPQGQQIRS